MASTFLVGMKTQHNLLVINFYKYLLLNTNYLRLMEWNFSDRSDAVNFVYVEWPRFAPFFPGS